MLEPGTDRPAPRLERAIIDPSGDTTVVFAIRELSDDPALIRAGALADTTTLLRGAYESPDASRISALTVIGTLPFKGTKSLKPRESPVLRAVLSAKRAAELDLDQLTPARVPTAVDTWWLQAAFANVGTDIAPDQAASGDGAELGARLAVARAHLDEALLALQSGNVGVGRSQFKQFFDLWDDLQQSVAQLDPTGYEGLDLELDRAEIALLHTQPEDLPSATLALANAQDALDTIGGRFSPAQSAEAP